MSNIFLIIKNYYRMFLCKLVKKKEIKITTMIFMLFFALFFAAIFLTLSYGTIQIAIDSGDPTIALPSFSITIIMFSFMLIVTESSPTRKHTDEEMLLCLPFKKREIVIAKLIYFFSFDFIVIIFLVLPSYLLYNIMVAGSSWLISLRAFYIIICSCLLANGVSSLINALFTKIAKNFQYSEIIKSIFSVLMLISFLIVYMLFIFISQNVTKTVAVYDFYPVRQLTSFIKDGLFSAFLIITIFSFSIFILSVIIKAHSLGKTINVYKTKKLDVSYKAKRVRKSLFGKEISKYFSSPLYVTNTIFGPLFVIIIAIVIAIIGKDYFIDLIQMVMGAGYENGVVPSSITSFINENFSTGIIIIITLLIAIAPTTCISISYERNQLWLLKAHPIYYYDVFIAKNLVNLVVTSIPIFISALLLSLRLGIIYLPFLLIIPLLASICSTNLGLYINLKHPKLVWESEQEVIKQSASLLITLFANLFIVIIAIIGYFTLNINVYLKLTIVIIYYLLLVAISTLILFKKGKLLYEKL